ncbi:hypothetical protein EON67_11425 [archaeon]|nr:MAG: hypothetical protein EON67_11425 [archaeon]
MESRAAGAARTCCSSHAVTAESTPPEMPHTTCTTPLVAALRDGTWGGEHNDEVGAALDARRGRYAAPHTHVVGGGQASALFVMHTAAARACTRPRTAALPTAASMLPVPRPTCSTMGRGLCAALTLALAVQCAVLPHTLSGGTFWPPPSRRTFARTWFQQAL